MGYLNIFNRIPELLIERGEIVVSPDYDVLVRGSDCLLGDLDLYLDRVHGNEERLKGTTVHYHKTLKDGRMIYRLVREEQK